MVGPMPYNVPKNIKMVTVGKEEQAYGIGCGLREFINGKMLHYCLLGHTPSPVSYIFGGIQIILLKN